MVQESGVGPTALESGSTTQTERTRATACSQPA